MPPDVPSAQERKPQDNTAVAADVMLVSPDMHIGKTCYTDDSLNAIKRFGSDLIKETKNLAVQTKA